mmetsp:Transcript_9448/g.14044  ORF Transcript_9448/g.14044 Transcript_9448/m.14044 type:complete len:316 (-) Transcript_9448:241-1188(-)
MSHKISTAFRNKIRRTSSSSNRPEHRLTKQSMRRFLSPSSHRSSKNWKTIANISPLSKKKKSASNNPNSTTSPSSVDSLTRRGAKLTRQGAFSEALHCFEEALSVQSEQVGRDDLSLADTYSDIGSLLLVLGRYEQGLDALEECIRLRQAPYVLKTDFVCAAGSLMQMAQSYAIHGKYEEALEYFDRVLRIHRVSYGRNSMVVAATLEKLGAVYFRIERYDSAMKSFEEVLSILRRQNESLLSTSGDKVDQKMAAIVYNIGVIHKKKGSYKKARDCFSGALKLYKKVGNTMDSVERRNSIRLLKINILKMESRIR